MEKREIKGLSILAKNEPVALSEETFLVPSQSSDKKYKVTKIDGWSCECADFKYRKVKCKHILSVEFLLKLRNKVNNDEVLEFVDELEEKSECHFCKSVKIVRNGVIKNKKEKKQRFFCKDCKKTFYKDAEFNYIRNPKIITLAFDLFYKGLSLRKITDTINQFFGIKVHHETVRRWLLKFGNAMDEYTKQFTPKVSEAWYIDEQAIKSKGKQRWVWNTLDENTRFLIASNITDSRYLEDAQAIVRKSKQIAKVKPRFIITDKLSAYEKAIKREFPLWWHRNSQIDHISIVGRRKEVNNNLIERYHSTFRERDKTMRGFKGGEQNFADGFRTYYNFIKQHQGLNGLTPSQKAEIDLQLERNRWLDLLRKSLNSNNKI